MVQIIGASPASLQAAKAGESIGSGLSNALSMYFQNQQNQQQQSELAKLLFGDEADNYKNLPLDAQLKAAQIQKPSSPLGGLSGQPVPPEVREKIPEILNTNKMATADELAVKFDEAGIPRAYSNSYIENRRRQDEQNEARGIKREEIGRKELIEFHKEHAKLDESLSKKAESAQRKEKAIKRQMELQPSISNFDRFVTATFAGSPYEDLFKAKNAQEFDSLALPLIEGQKENFGVRLSDADLRLVLQKIATSTKNPEANRKIAEWNLLESELDQARRKIADEIKKENKGLRPLDFDVQIRERMNKKFGDKIENKKNEILSLTDDPNKLEKIGRVKVPHGTPLTVEVIDKYLKMSNNDPKLAEKMAAEDGYVY